MTKPSGAKRHYDMPLPAKQQRGRQAFGGPARAAGIGPNKACGHKGGIRRQGSKRGQPRPTSRNLQKGLSLLQVSFCRFPFAAMRG